MERLYNPDQMPPQEIKDTFVARQCLVDRLTSLIRHQPEGAGVQHVVIVGPRGMGKTTLLLMVQFAVAEQGLTPPWQVIRFPEELYSVTDLAEFWLETLRSLAHDTSDAALSRQTDQIQAKYSGNSDDLRDAALAFLKDWCRTHSRRLALLVDNFHLILSQINDDRENAGLRSVLMNDGFLMLIGAAPSIFREAAGYDQALYNFFKIEHLENLTSAQTQDLLRRRAAADGLAHFDQILQANRARFRVLEYFTGGNPRLVLMLYRVIAQSEVLEVRQGLEKLLDQVTPYYKDKMEILPPQQRKILDYIARESSRTHEGVTPTEIAKGTRLAANVVSSQLKRLLDAGYVRTANLRGRSTYYTLAEPLYAIWYQMRFGRDARQRMGWLISFLKGWYDTEELGQESERLEKRFREHLNAGRNHEARGALELYRYMTEASDDVVQRIHSINTVVGGYLAIGDIDAVSKEILPGINLQVFTPELLQALVLSGCLSQEDADHVAVYDQRIHSSVDDMTARIILRLSKGQLEEAWQIAEQLVLSDPDDYRSWLSQSVMLGMLSRFEESRLSFERARQMNPDDKLMWILYGTMLEEGGRFEEALAIFDEAIAAGETDKKVWFIRAGALSSLKRLDEALTSINLALASTDNPKYLRRRAAILGDLGRCEEALEDMNRVLQVNPNDALSWFMHGRINKDADKKHEALASYDKAIELNPNSKEVLFERSLLLGELDRGNEAIVSLDRAISLDANDVYCWLGRGLFLFSMEKYEDALINFDHASQLQPDNYRPWYFRGQTLFKTEKDVEALDNFERALKLIGNQEIQDRIEIYFLKLMIGFSHGNLELIKHDWLALMEAGKHDPSWHEEAVELLLAAVRDGYLDFVRSLITDSQISDLFFPLSHALDYLSTSDEALIEKLSPEMRRIVEEIVVKLRPVAETTDAAN